MSLRAMLNRRSTGLPGTLNIWQVASVCHPGQAYSLLEPALGLEALDEKCDRKVVCLSHRGGGSLGGSCHCG